MIEAVDNNDFGTHIKSPLLPPHRTKRSLEARHLQMIAIGGTIGTGLFVGSGAAIAVAGPAGALLAFAIVSIMVFCIVTSLGEMATFLPISGSFNSYAARFVDPALSFTLSWNYFVQWALSLPCEISAIGIIMGFWSDSSTWIWSLLVLILLFTVNAIGVRSFAETEYWLSAVKIVAVVLFVIVCLYTFSFFLQAGLFVDIGAFGEPAVGFDNYSIPEAPFKNGVAGILNVFLLAFFAFGGTELVGVAAGETRNPKINVPKAIYGTFWRIFLFYILSIFVMGLVIRHDDPKLLLGKSKSGLDVTVSPFTLVFQRLPIAGSNTMANIMNGVILSAVISAGNSAMYAGSRTLMAMGRDGNAPLMFASVNSRGVPMNALLAITAIGCLSFLSVFVGDSIVFQSLLSLTGVSGIMTWTSISIIHIRFRKALVAQNRDYTTELPYHAPFHPYSAYLAIALGLMIVILQGYAASSTSPFQIQNLLSTYLGVPVFAGLFIYYKVSHRTKLVGLSDIDLDTDNIWSIGSDDENEG